jgi:oligopeptide transport system permease protein
MRVHGFVVGRLLQMVVTLLVAVSLLWVAVTVLPGDPVRAMFGFTPPPQELYDRVVRQYHLDEPVWLQYLYYLGNLLTLNLGNSYPSDPWGDASPGPEVTSLLAATLPVSARLLVSALVVQAVVGVLAGILAAAGKDRWVGRGATWLALLLVATPVLVVASVSRAFLGFRLGWFPAAGVYDGAISYVLPVLSLAALSTGYVALLARSELLAALRATYVQAARARGLPRWRVAGVHALRPSLIPVATFLAANIGPLVTGLIIVEGVFRIRGIGGLLFGAVLSHDRNLIVGLVAVVAATVIVANALADIVVAAIDPRIRFANR